MGERRAIIIGAGPAGLALSYHLSRRGVAHCLLEAGQVGESWRRRRWDSLRLVAPNWHLQLPGMPYAGDDPDGFLHRDEVVAYIEAYARRLAAPAQAHPHYDQAHAAAAQAPAELELGRAGIAGVWATGYRPGFDWVRLPVFAPDGYPIHRRGVTAYPGLSFLGLEWQHTAQSHVFQGLGADAAYLAEVIAARVGASGRVEPASPI